MIRILVVDDHDLVREGVRALLEKDPDLKVVGETGDGRQAIALYGELKPDVVLMDVSLPGGIGGLEALEAIRGGHAEARVIVLTQYENREYIRRAIRLGAQGYLPKRAVAQELREAVKTVFRGKRYLHQLAADELVDLVAAGQTVEQDDYDSLTPREKQVFKLLAEGKTSRDIARYLEIGLKTAMTHRQNIMAKLNIHSRAELVKYAIRKAVIQVDPG